MKTPRPGKAWFIGATSFKDAEKPRTLPRIVGLAPDIASSQTAIVESKSLAVKSARVPGSHGRKEVGIDPRR